MQLREELRRVAADAIDSVRYVVHSRIVFQEFQPTHLQVDGDDMSTRARQLDGVPSNPRERVDDDSTGAANGREKRQGFGSDGKQADFVEPNPLVPASEQMISLDRKSVV